MTNFADNYQAEIREEDSFEQSQDLELPKFNVHGRQGNKKCPPTQKKWGKYGGFSGEHRANTSS
jgi:hypothetical protein